TREIAAACNIERGGLHYHFNKKQDILFELYRQFYSFMYDSIIDQFSDEDEAVLIIISNMLLYRILLTHTSLSRMMVSVMRNRDLTKAKITETSRVLENKTLQVGYPQIRFALSIAIGAEVELILQLTEGEIDLSLDELARWVSGLALTALGYSSADVDRYYHRALECVEMFDVKAFAETMEQNVTWFQQSDIQ
ncbi:MAG TPA: TetR family transcriptional regulator, partial [Desulfosporosinus sp.]|nr:TetR family transcriptional regulator [Desulfosporosinus sp.]